MSKSGGVTKSVTKAARVMEKSASMSYHLFSGGKSDEREREREKKGKRDKRVKGWPIENSRGRCRGWQRVQEFAFIGRRTGPRPRCQRYSKCNLHRWRLPAEITNALWLEQVFYRSLPEDRNELSERKRETERENGYEREKGSFETAQKVRKERWKKRNNRQIEK